MNEHDFSQMAARVIADVGALSEAANSNPELLGTLSFEDYQLFSGFVKEYAWQRG